MPAPKMVVDVKEKLSSDDAHCNICNVELSSKIVAVSHYQGRRR
jgi:hypothetical protein